MTAVSKNVYTNKLDEVVKKHDKTYHRKINIKLAEGQPSTYIEYDVKYNYKDPNSKLVIT